MANGRMLVNTPALSPLPYGLLSVVNPLALSDNHWQNGITYLTDCINVTGASTYDDCIAVTGTGSPPPPSDKAPSFDRSTHGATSFTPYAEFDCSPVGLEDAQKIATTALSTVESWQVEYSFWTGLSGGQQVVFPHLAADSREFDADGKILQSVPVTGGTFDPAEALGFLESYLATCLGGVGVIHIPRSAIPTFDAYGLLKPSGGVLKTLNGNKVAAGAGYPGTSPAGVAPAADTTWIYATAEVFEQHSAVRVTGVPDSLDRAANTLRMIAERTYVLGWGCCHAGALINLGVSWELQ